jgi:hypothetical protein
VLPEVVERPPRSLRAPRNHREAAEVAVTSQNLTLFDGTKSDSSSFLNFEEELH